MSTPTKGKTLLSEKEKDRLRNPPDDANIRKRNNLIVKEKVKRWLNGAADVGFALDHLKDTKIEGVFQDEDIFALFEATQKLLERLHFAPVEGDPQRPFISWPHITTEKDAKKYKGAGTGTLAFFHRRATPSDLERNWRVSQFARKLEQFYESNPEKESPAWKKYRINRENKEIRESCRRFGLKQPDYLPGEEDEVLLKAIETAQRLGDYGTTEEERDQIAELKEKVAKQQSESEEEPPK